MQVSRSEASAAFQRYHSQNFFLTQPSAGAQSCFFCCATVGVAVSAVPLSVCMGGRSSEGEGELSALLGNVCRGYCSAEERSGWLGLLAARLQPGHQARPYASPLIQGAHDNGSMHEGCMRSKIVHVCTFTSMCHTLILCRVVHTGGMSSSCARAGGGWSCARCGRGGTMPQRRACRLVGRPLY